MNHKSILETAIGLRQLGMFEDALAELLQIPTESKTYYLAQDELLKVRLSLGAYELAAETGLQILQRRQGSRATIFNTSLALWFLGRIAEARRLLEALPHLGKYHPEESYQMACLESRAGDFAAAMCWLESALRFPTHYLCKSLIDSDLQPFWGSLELRTLTLPECQLLQTPAFANLRERSASCGLELELDGNDLKALPAKWRRLFKFVPMRGAYSIHALTAVSSLEDRAACETWFRGRAESSLRSLDLARDKAAAVLRRTTSL